VEIKQVIVVRKDLRMGIGKIASQVGHAAVLGVERSRKYNKLWLRNWFNEGQPKIVVKVNSFEELLQVQSDAEDSNGNCDLHWNWSCSIRHYR